MGKDLLTKCEDMSWDPQNLKLESVCYNDKVPLEMGGEGS